MAKYQSREPCKIYISASLSNGGMYRKRDRTIHISEFDVIDNGFKCMDTIIHEGRHAYQDDVINGRITKYELLREIWGKNDCLGCYITHAEAIAANEYCDYYFQPQEIDAYKYAKHQMAQIEESLKEDPKYQEYIWQIKNLEETPAIKSAYLKYRTNLENVIVAKVQEQIEARYREKVLGVRQPNREREIKQTALVEPHKLPYKPTVEESEKSIGTINSNHHASVEQELDKQTQEEEYIRYYNLISH